MAAGRPASGGDEALALLREHHDPFDPRGWDPSMYEVLQREFAALSERLADHGACGRDVAVNVRWW